MTTATDIITDAALAAGIGDQYNGLDTISKGVALRTLNRLLDEWSNESLVVWNVSQGNFALTSGTATYSTSLLSARPMQVLSIFVRQNGVDYPIEMIGNKDYANIGYKTTSGQPSQCWYNSDFPNGSFNFFPVPATGYTAYVQYRAALAQLALTDTISVPPGYETAMVYGLATMLCPLFGTDPTPTCIFHAKDSKAKIKPQNEPINEAQFNVPLGRGLFNIFQGY